jgi:hypothetical protein
MKAQGNLEDLTPAGGIVAIIAGILLMVMIPPSIPSSAPQLEYFIIYGFGFILIAAGIAAIISALR